MPRARFGVALLLPPPIADQVDGLRWAWGDPALGRIAPHVTLVPPVNLRSEDLGQALRVLRGAAAASRPLDLLLGPIRSFPTHDHVVYLAVSGGGEGPDAQVRALEDLRRALVVAPLGRAPDHDFVPHVTVARGLDPARLGHVLATGSHEDGGLRREARFEALHLLEQRHDGGYRRWVPVADIPLGPPVVVGRGGLPVELSPGELADPEAVGWWRDTLVGEPWPPEPLPPGTRPLVTVARREGDVAGIACGWTAGPVAELVAVRAAPPDLGVSGHLVAAWWSAAADRGASEPFTP